MSRLRRLVPIFTLFFIKSIDASIISTQTILKKSKTTTTTTTTLLDPPPPPFPYPGRPGDGDDDYFYLRDNSLKGLWWQIILTGIFWLVMIGLFLSGRSMGKTGRRIFGTRTEVMKKFTPPWTLDPRELLTTFISTTDGYILENVGLDAVMFLRFLKTSWQIIGTIAIIVVPIVIPINYYSNIPDDPQDLKEPQQFVTTGLARFSMGNIPPGSNWLWIHLIFIYAVTCIVAYFTFTTYRDYVALENEYLRADSNLRRKHHELLQFRTIMVRDIPPELCTDEKLAEYFGNLGIGKVEYAVMDRMTDGALYRMIIERDKALIRLEHAYMSWFNACKKAVPSTEQLPLLSQQLDPRKRPLHRPSFGAEPVDSIDYYSTLYLDLTSKITSRRRAALSNTAPYLGNSGFVTFETQQAATIASQVLLKYSNNPFTMTALLAPHPHDVDWSAFSTNLEQKQMQGFLVGVTVFFLTFFWSIPVGFISTFTTISSLSKVPWLKPVLDKLLQVEWMAILIETLLPPLLFRVFLSLVPFIMQWLSDHEGIEASSWKELAVFDKLYAFLLFNVLFVFALSNAAFNVIGGMIDNPISIINLLGTVLPKGASFFTNYVIYSSSMFAWELGRPLVMLSHWIRSSLCTTPRDFYKLNRETSYMDFGIHYPYHVIILVIVIVYSVQAPIVLLAGLGYFAFGYLVYKHQLLYVYVKEWESYGRHWPMIFNRVVWGLLIMQAVMMGMLGVKQAPLLAGLLIPLMFATYAFYNYCNVAFGPRSRFVPLDQLTGTERRMVETNTPTDLFVPQPTPLARLNGSNTGRNIDLRAFTGDEGVVGMARHSFYLNPALSSDLPNPWLPAKVVSSLPKNDPLVASMYDGDGQDVTTPLDSGPSIDPSAQQDLAQDAADDALDDEQDAYITPLPRKIHLDDVSNSIRKMLGTDR